MSRRPPSSSTGGGRLPELAAISADQAEALAGVIDAVLDGIGLTTEQRERAIAILVVELRRAAGEEP